MNLATCINADKTGLKKLNLSLSLADKEITPSTNKKCGQHCFLQQSKVNIMPPTHEIENKNNFNQQQ